MKLIMFVLSPHTHLARYRVCSDVSMTIRIDSQKLVYDLGVSVHTYTTHNLLFPGDFVENPSRKGRKTLIHQYQV